MPSDRDRKRRAYPKKDARSPRFWSECLLQLCRVLWISLKRETPMVARKRFHVTHKGGTSCCRSLLDGRRRSRAEAENKKTTTKVDKQQRAGCVFNKRFRTPSGLFVCALILAFSRWCDLAAGPIYSRLTFCRRNVWHVKHSLAQRVSTLE